MRFLTNLIWVLLFGIPYAILLFLIGVLCSITIILLPFGIQCFKLIGIHFNPKKYNVEIDPTSHFVLNLLWAVFMGLELAITHLVFGIICCVTIIGIPLGLRSFKLMRASYAPFGAVIDAD